jgi:uncharacterized protein (DUF924 family)
MRQLFLLDSFYEPNHMNSRQPMPDDILAFWFKEITPKLWWGRSGDVDRQIKSRFGALHDAAERCELYGWRESAGRLAEIIVLDQFSRNLYRSHPKAYANDSLALALAQKAVAANADANWTPHSKLSFTCPTCTASHRSSTRLRFLCSASRAWRAAANPNFDTRTSSTVSAVIHTATSYWAEPQPRKKWIF